MAASDDDFVERQDGGHDHDGDPAGEVAPTPPWQSPLAGYFRALSQYDGQYLAGLAGLHHLHDSTSGRPAMGQAISDRLSEPGVAGPLIAGLPRDSRVALGLLALLPAGAIASHALAHALQCLGIGVAAGIDPLVSLGIIAAEFPNGELVRDGAAVSSSKNGVAVKLHAHPGVLSHARTLLPSGPSFPVAREVRQIREADGLEPILRLAALWQRVADAPMRRTQHGVVYKRDRDRLEGDPILAGPIADTLEPLPDMPSLWLALALGIGLIVEETESDRVIASPAAYWSENAFHLSQMICAQWVALKDWHEQGGFQQNGATHELALPHVRLPILMWLATLPEGGWVRLDELATHLRTVHESWDVPSFDLMWGTTPAAGAGRSTNPKRGKGAAAAPNESSGLQTLEAMLLGPAYQLGVVRLAEEAISGARVAQLTPLGRYLLALGPPPPPRQTFDHFLFVQPNLDVIAYRQGLTPSLIGEFSRFADWTQISAALTLRLTTQSVYRGLEGGLGSERMLSLLTAHSPRPLPASVVDVLRTWSGRRERVTYYSSATLIEFAHATEAERALESWPASEAPRPLLITDRLLLVEAGTPIPFQRFRMTGSRDYRRPPEACVEVGEDGVTLALDPSRSDLLVDAEVTRFADEVAEFQARPSSGPVAPLRRFQVTMESLERGAELGLSPASLSQWFQKRAGQDTPAAIRLMLGASKPKAPPLLATRPLVVQLPAADWLDGLIQHPATRDLLGDRLGPTTVIIPDNLFPSFQAALARLGLEVSPPPEK